MNTKTSRQGSRRRLRTRRIGGDERPPMLAERIEHVPIDHINPYEANPRDHDDRQVAKLAGIIQKVGFLVPIIIDDANTIIAGHGRWAAAKQLGLHSIPAIRAAHLSAHQVQAFRLADNRISEESAWDKRALALEFKALAAAIDLDPEILELTAFEIAEIDLHIESLDEHASAPDRADLLPAPGPAVTRPGDVWCLGPHRLLCGSALEPESYRLLLQGHHVQAVWSDPPFNVAVSGHVCGLGQVQHREFAMASGEMSESEFTSFLASYLAFAKEHSLPGSLHYVCMDGPHAFEVLSAARKADLRFKVTCTWAKTNAGMGSFYRHQTEFVHVFKNGGDEIPHLNNIQLGKYGRYRTTLWTYAGVNTFRKGRMDDLQAHPTVKPWALVADAIKDCTGIGDSVLDCFCGSGTTLIAAQKAHRIGYGIELDPIYVDVAVRRWQALTGKQALHAGTGQSFAAMQAERATQAGVAADVEEADHG
jgi:DNA modification methylase